MDRCTGNFTSFVSFGKSSKRDFFFGVFDFDLGCFASLAVLAGLAGRFDFDVDVDETSFTLISVGFFPRTTSVFFCLELIHPIFLVEYKNDKVSKLAKNVLFHIE